MSLRLPVILLILCCFLMSSGCAGTKRKTALENASGQAAEVTAAAGEAPAESSGESTEMPEKPKSTIEKLMETSGLNKQLDQLPIHIQQGFALSKKVGGGTDADYAPVEKILMESFSASALKSAMANRLSELLSEGEMNDVLDWLNSDLGRRITYLEEKASTPASLDRMNALADSLRKSGRETGRTELMKKFDQAVGLTEGTVNMVLSIDLAKSLAIAGSTDPADDDLFDRIMESVQVRKPMVEKVTEERITLHLLYTYQMLKESEIRKYLSFAESSTGKKYHEATLKAMTETLTDGARDLGRELGRLLKEKKE